MQIGKTIKILRAFNCLSQKELATKAQMSTSYVCDIENGKRIPSLETITKISQAFNIKVWEFFLAEDNLSNLKEGSFPFSVTNQTIISTENT